MVAGEYDGQLSNGGERVILASPSDDARLDFEYDDGWYPETDGGGHSLVLENPGGDPSTLGDRASWRPSGEPGGSPGE